jgi:predicted nuclease of predicted toxin-antitoxin system
LTIVTQDSDFAGYAALYGPPPKVIWLRCGNQPTDDVAQLIRHQASAVSSFEADATAGCLEIY